MSSPARPLPLWRRLLRLAGLLLVLLVVGSATRFLWMTRDRHPGYSVDTRIQTTASAADPKPLRAGFGRRDITPDVTNPARPVWMAGFDQGRSATNVHDALSAVAAVVDDGHHRIAIVAMREQGDGEVAASRTAHHAHPRRIDAQPLMLGSHPPHGPRDVAEHDRMPIPLAAEPVAQHERSDAL
jgi:hypothetical protein